MEVWNANYDSNRCHSCHPAHLDRLRGSARAYHAGGPFQGHCPSVHRWTRCGVVVRTKAVAMGFVLDAQRCRGVGGSVESNDMSYPWCEVCSVVIEHGFRPLEDGDVPT